MIVIVLGMSKSGTTLIAKTLHHSGINMNPIRTGSYSQSKYEDPIMIKILQKMLNVEGLPSLYLPKTIVWNDEIKKDIKNYLKTKHGDWGVKQPYLTLCYELIRLYLPEHIVVAAKRNPIGLLKHYSKGKKLKKSQEEEILKVQAHYNEIIDRLNIPVINFENFVRRGPIVLSKIIGRKLVDVRDGRKHL